MNKERKIKVVDNKRWAIKIFASSAVLFIVMLIIFSAVENNEDLSTLMILILLCLTMVTLGYWMYSYKSSMKYISVKEYCEINKNVTDVVLMQQLKKQAFTEEEINEILKDRPVTKYVENQNQKIVPRKNILDNLKESFVISNKLLTKAGFGIVIDSNSEEIAIIQPNKEIQYVKFNQIHSYNVSQQDRTVGTGAMVYASLTGNDSLYRLGMANTVAGNKNIYDYIIQLVMNNVDSPNIDIHILHKKMINNTSEFAEIESVAKSITSFLDKVISNNGTNSEKKNDFGKIKDLKVLFDMGAITEEEFEEKKKELLK